MHEFSDRWEEIPDCNGPYMTKMTLADFFLRGWGGVVHLLDSQKDHQENRIRKKAVALHCPSRALMGQVKLIIKSTGCPKKMPRAKLLGSKHDPLLVII